MTIELHEDEAAGLVAVCASDKLTKADYERLVPEVERLIAEHGKIRMLFEMRDFHGWEADAMWEDIKFDLKHFSDIERLAIVGERKWEKAMAILCKPFTTAEIRYFDRREIDAASCWVRGE